MIKKKLVEIKDYLDYIIWKLENFQKSYSDYYVEKVSINYLNTNKEHPTLGNNFQNEDRFRKRAEDQLKYLIQQGLNHNSKVLDYGCGSLRNGELLINYLDPNNYYGLDVTDRFYNIALKKFPQSILDTKKPTFGIINNSTLLNIKDESIDFIISFGVLQHIPPQKIEDFFNKILSVGKRGIIIFIDFKENTKNKKKSSMTWFYSEKYLLSKLDQLSCEYKFVDIENDLDKDLYDSNYKMLKIVKL